MAVKELRTARPLHYDPCYCGCIMKYTDDETAPQFCSAACRASYREGYREGVSEERLGMAHVMLDRLDTVMRNDS